MAGQITHNSTSSALTADDFSRLMTAFTPFEDAPVVAVGLSGGRDSLALCLLAHRWAQVLGGCVIALTVDHGLRDESTAEARQVASWMALRGITHHTLVWAGDKPITGRQAAARMARYELLKTWCRDNNVLHLMLGHHADDQVETVVMRKQSGSGAAGLAGMSAIVETDDFRILRPLLNVPRSALTATLQAMRQKWIDDPSNIDTRYARSRLRRDLDDLQIAQQAGQIGAAGDARIERETAVSAFIARHVSLHPAGYAWAAPHVWSGPTAQAAMSRILSCLGGAGYPPGPDPVSRLVDDLCAPGFSGRTLGGCKITPMAHDGKPALLISRENRNLGAPVPIVAGATALWDGRFAARGGLGSLTLGALGATGWGDAKERFLGLAALNLPESVRATLPVVYNDGELAAIFAGRMFWSAPGNGADSSVGAGGQNGLRLPVIRFAPRVTLSGGGFCLAQPIGRTMSTLGTETALEKN